MLKSVLLEGFQYEATEQGEWTSSLWKIFEKKLNNNLYKIWNRDVIRKLFPKTCKSSSNLKEEWRNSYFRNISPGDRLGEIAKRMFPVQGRYRKDLLISNTSHEEIKI